MDMSDGRLSIRNLIHENSEIVAQPENIRWGYAHTPDLRAAFRWAYRSNHLDMVRWLYSQAEIDLHEYGDEPFKYACTHGYLSLAVWIRAQGGISDEVIKTALECSWEPPVCAWLQSL